MKRSINDSIHRDTKIAKLHHDNSLPASDILALSLPKEDKYKLSMFLRQMLRLMPSNVKICAAYGTLLGK